MSEAAASTLFPVTVHTEVAPTHGYARARGDIADVDDKPRVHALIAERRLAKRSRDFKKADALRDELRRECNVEIFDKTMIWKVVGSQGHVPLPSGQESGREARAPAAPAVAEAQKLRKKHKKAAKKKAAAVAEAPISTGIGHDMLLKMGWAGQGSGLREGAIAEPIRAKKPKVRKLRQTVDAAIASGQVVDGNSAAAEKKVVVAASPSATGDGSASEAAPPKLTATQRKNKKARLKRKRESCGGE